MNKIFWLQPEDTQLGHWQKKISSLSGSPTFCVLPWIHFATRPNGDMRLCCGANSSGAGLDHEIGLIKTENGTPANFGKITPMTRDIIDLDGHYILKIFILLLLFLGIKSIKLVKK